MQERVCSGDYIQQCTAVGPGHLEHPTDGLHLPAAAHHVRGEVEAHLPQVTLHQLLTSWKISWTIGTLTALSSGSGRSCGLVLTWWAEKGKADERKKAVSYEIVPKVLLNQVIFGNLEEKNCGSKYLKKQNKKRGGGYVSKYVPVFVFLFFIGLPNVTTNL